jgi:cell division protein FtsQ
MSRVAAPADKRFRRAHVKPTRRRRWHAVARPLVKYGFLGAVLAFGLYRGGHVIADARVLQIAAVDVRGNHQLSKAAVVDMLDGLRGENILRVDLEGWRDTLRRSSWIQDASLRRVFPSTIEVSVQEREPISLARLDGHLYLVDSLGVVIDEFGPSYAGFDLPIVDGLEAPKKGSKRSVDPVRAELAARLIRDIRSDPEIEKRLSQVDVSDSRNAGVILIGDPTLLFVGNDRFLQRVKSYLELADTMNANVPGIDSVDLRFDKQVIVRVAGRAMRREVPSPEGTIGSADESRQQR